MRKIIYLNLLIVSFVIMGLEMTATRLIAPTFGNTVYTWGIIISIFLIGSSVGYMIGGYVADNKENKTIAMFFYLGSIVLIAITPIIKEVFFPLLEGVSSVLGTTIGVTVLYFIPNLLLSSVVPVLMKMGLDDKVSGKVIGNLHTASAIGSVLGTLLTTFLFIPYANINTVIGLLTGMLTFAYIIYYAKKTPIHKILLFIPIVFLFIPFIFEEEKENGTLYHKTSLYHDIYVYETEGKDLETYRYLSFGNKTTIQGMMNMNKPDEIVLNYVRNILDVSKTYTNDSESVFIIGHGIGTLTKYYESEMKRVKVAELDDEVLKVSRKYFGYQGDSVVIGDGRKILQDEKEKYDVIILDAYHNTENIPFHLITKEFFQLSKEKLNQDGLLVINAIGTPNEDEIIQSMNATLKEVYPYVYLLGETNAYSLQNIVIIGSGKPLELTEMKRLNSFKVDDGEIILDNDTKLHNLN